QAGAVPAAAVVAAGEIFADVGGGRSRVVIDDELPAGDVECSFDEISNLLEVERIDATRGCRDRSDGADLRLVDLNPRIAADGQGILLDARDGQRGVAGDGHAVAPVAIVVKRRHAARLREAAVADSA